MAGPSFSWRVERTSVERTSVEPLRVKRPMRNSVIWLFFQMRKPR